jgi:putative ABC transport system ATP-binding protein
MDGLTKQSHALRWPGTIIVTSIQGRQKTSEWRVQKYGVARPAEEAASQCECCIANCGQRQAIYVAMPGSDATSKRLVAPEYVDRMPRIAGHTLSCVNLRQESQWKSAFATRSSRPPGDTMQSGAVPATQPAHEDKPAAFRARALTKVYYMGETEVHALRGVDLDIHEGELVVLLGPSGSGKSTLLNILDGLDRPTSGQVYFRDHELTACNDHQLTSFRRRHVGFIFQFYNLIPSLTARENVSLVTELVAQPMKAEEALKLVGLADRMDHFPAQMSGGEQQRVAVARSIAKRPEVLLCDEPTGALDSATGIRVLEALADVNQTLGTTTVVITHNASIAAMADHIIRFGDGRITSVETNATKRKASEVSW